MKPYKDAVVRLAEVPGFGIDSAQQVIAEMGATACTFPSAAEFTSWVGTCPGKEESAEENHSSRCAKGNKYMRRILNQVAHAAVRSKGTHFQAVFRRLLPRLGYLSAVWAVAHRLCRLVWKILHERMRYIEQGTAYEPKLLIDRAQSLARSRESRRKGRPTTATMLLYCMGLDRSFAQRPGMNSSSLNDAESELAASNLMHRSSDPLHACQDPIVEKWIADSSVL